MLASLAVYISGVPRMPVARPRVKLKILAIAFALLLACAGLIFGRTNAPAVRTALAPTEQLALNASNPPSTPVLHDLAIAAVDFDPESSPQRIFSGRPYNLLVA